MITQKAIVINTDKGEVALEVERESTCSHCQLKQGCGTGMLAEHVGKRFSRITLQHNADVVPGQAVQIGISEQALLRGAVLMYLLPLVGLLLFSAIAVWLGFSPGMEIFLGLCGLCTGFVLVRRYFRTGRDDINAKIIEERKWENS